MSLGPDRALLTAKKLWDNPAGAEAGPGSDPDLEEAEHRHSYSSAARCCVPCPGLLVLGQQYPSAAESHPLVLGWWQLPGKGLRHAVPFSRGKQQGQQAAGEASEAALPSAAAQRLRFGGLAVLGGDGSRGQAALDTARSLGYSWQGLPGVWGLGRALRSKHQPWLAQKGVKFGIQGEQRLLENV